MIGIILNKEVMVGRMHHNCIEVTHDSGSIVSSSTTEQQVKKKDTFSFLLFLDRKKERTGRVKQQVRKEPILSSKAYKNLRMKRKRRSNTLVLPKKGGGISRGRKHFL